eukprot:COSAG01_NODE_48408_length_381_cov_1.549645_1_plen_91_part_10
MVGVAELDIIQTVPQDGSAAKGDDNRVQVSVRGQSLQLSGSGTDASVMHPSVQLSRTEPTTIVVKLSGSSAALSHHSVSPGFTPCCSRVTD